MSGGQPADGARHVERAAQAFEPRTTGTAHAALRELDAALPVIFGEARAALARASRLVGTARALTVRHDPGDPSDAG